MTPKHYDLPIQPVEYILANELGFCEGNVVKYISRWRSKGRVEDLRKARDYIDMLIAQEVRAERRLAEGLAFNESRIDIIAQNGNDGAHYGEM